MKVADMVGQTLDTALVQLGRLSQSDGVAVSVLDGRNQLTSADFFHILLYLCTRVQ
jgi:hypothetical protein